MLLATSFCQQAATMSAYKFTQRAVASPDAPQKPLVRKRARSGGADWVKNSNVPVSEGESHCCIPHWERIIGIMRALRDSNTYIVTCTWGNPSHSCRGKPSIIALKENAVNPSATTLTFTNLDNH